VLARAGAALLFAALEVGILASGGAARSAPKDRDTVRTTADQMHQLGISKVELYPFRVQKFAVGQIAYNEDTSTAVLAPFPGRVTRLIAKIGDKVKRGERLFEIDSPDVRSRRTISWRRSLP
jgi:cobalt-zinc-cadmium efflux system membrane fusion protein